MADLLLILAFENRKIFFVQASDQAIHRIGDSNGNKHQVDVHFQWMSALESRIKPGADVVYEGGLGRLNLGPDVNVIYGRLSKSKRHTCTEQEKQRNNSSDRITHRWVS